MSDRRKMVILGQSLDEDGNAWKVGAPLPDFQTHAVVFGSTGSGKSTFLRNLGVQTFGLGAATCIVEPHGDLCLDVMAGAPSSDLDRVVYLALDSPQPFSLPLMTVGLGAGMDVGVESVMSVLRMAEPASWDQSARMREILRNSIRVMLDVQGWKASLLGLDRFLTKRESAFREAILSQVSEENRRSADFCRDEVAAALDGEKGKAGLGDSIMAAQRRLEVFITDLRFRRSLALPPLGPRISLPDLLRSGKMVLLPVNSAAIGPKAASLLSMMFMQLVKGSLLSRTDKADRTPAAIIIDEFAAMAGGDGGELAALVDTLLREGRKFGAIIILATQSLAQLAAEVKKNLQVNTNIKVVLLVSDVDDAREAANILGSDLINDTDIRNMPKFHGYVRAMVNKSPKPPTLLQMLPPMSLAERDERRFASPEPPQVSDVWLRMRLLAREATDPTRPQAGEAVVRALRGLDELTWLRVVADAQAWNRYQAERLLAEPEREPDKIARAMKISRMLYGMPWWLREAHFWRELQPNVAQTPPASQKILIPGLERGRASQDFTE